MTSPAATAPANGPAPHRVNVALLVLAMAVTVLCNIPLGAVAVTFVVRGEDTRAKKWIVAAVAAGVVTAAILIVVRS